ncbi:hypothetical protein J6590_074294, partial [Homalodisca vitripennis]
MYLAGNSVPVINVWFYDPEWPQFAECAVAKHGNPSRITDVQAVNGPSGTVKSSRS